MQHAPRRVGTGLDYPFASFSCCLLDFLASAIVYTIALTDVANGALQDAAA